MIPGPAISIIVSIFGDIDHWTDVAYAAAVPSAVTQTRAPVDITVSAEPTLAQARNIGAEKATGDWLCFLDADDELDLNYLQAMSDAIERRHAHGDWLLQPATLGVVGDKEDPFPVVIPPKPLVDGNFMVIGTLVRREQFLRVGGFHEYPYAEDWELWLRCWIDGAHLAAVPEAIYRVHVRPNSRNQGDRKTQVRVYNEIRNRYLVAAKERASRT